MATEFRHRISKTPGDLPTVFKEPERLLALKYSLVNEERLLLIYKDADEKRETLNILNIHTEYTLGWVDILDACIKDIKNIKEPLWWRAGVDDADAVQHDSKQDQNERSFRKWCTRFNQLSRTNTHVLADSWTNIALIELHRLENYQTDLQPFIVPLHLTVLADQEQFKDAEQESKSEGGHRKIPTLIPYPSITSILDVYSNQKIVERDNKDEEEKSKEDEENEAESKELKPFIISWYGAVETGIRQGFNYYRQLAPNDRCWPERLYFRWAIDLSQLYKSLYKKKKYPDRKNRIELNERQVGGGSCGAAFALAAAQALARADRQGMFSVK